MIIQFPDERTALHAMTIIGTFDVIYANQDSTIVTIIEHSCDPTLVRYMKDRLLNELNGVILDDPE